MAWSIESFGGNRVYRETNGMVYQSVSSVVALLSGMDWSVVPSDTLEESIRHGSIAHDAACRHFSSMLYGNGACVASVSYEGMDLQVYNMALKDIQAFSDEWKVKPIAIEQIVTLPCIRMAGTIDLLCELYVPGTRKRLTSLVDFKRTHDITLSHKLQIQAYQMCLERFSMHIVHIKKEGGYSVVPVPTCDVSKAAIVSACNVLHYKMNGGIEA